MLKYFKGFCQVPIWSVYKHLEVQFTRGDFLIGNILIRKGAPFLKERFRLESDWLKNILYNKNNQILIKSSLVHCIFFSFLYLQVFMISRFGEGDSRLEGAPDKAGLIHCMYIYLLSISAGVDESVERFQPAEDCPWRCCNYHGSDYGFVPFSRCTTETRHRVWEVD